MAFLRAINTGRRRITNPELAEAVEALGFDHVAVYQASGNVLFGDRSDQNRRLLERELSTGLTDALGYDVPVIVRTASEVHGIAWTDAFDGEPAPPASKPQVILMADRPDAAAIAAHATDDDQLAVIGSDVHWRPRQGVSTSSLDVTTMERAFGCMTIRTLGTMQRISDRLPGGAS